MRYPRLVAFLGLVLAETTFSVGNATSIICKHSRLDELSWVEMHLASADVVFLGAVVSAKLPYPPEPDDPVVEPESQTKTPETITALLKELEEEYRKSNSFHVDQAVSFEVLKIWKGPPLSDFTAKNLVFPGRYGSPLKPDETYLVFAYKSDDNVFTVSTTCGTTRLAENAQERIEILNDLVKSIQPPNNAPH